MKPILAVPNSPSYPAEHAVVAGAAEVLLSYFFPGEASAFKRLAEEAADRVFMPACIIRAMSSTAWNWVAPSGARWWPTR